MRTPLPLPLPVGRSAVRPIWADLPGGVRERVQLALGAAVVEAVSQDGGFTPGFASRLRLADGRRFFVKAANEEDPWRARSYRDEAGKLALLPASVPAPRLQQVIDERIGEQQWIVLVIDDIEGRPPHRPWALADARRALDTAAGLAEALTPPPAGWSWDTLAGLLIDPSLDWAGLRDQSRWRGWPDHLEELVDLAGRPTELLGGDTLTHSDLRDDNLVVAADGSIWVCDWNWPTVGPHWTDAVTLAISMHGDGLDADALLAETGVVAEDDREAVDCLLAALTGYFLLASSRPAHPSSPYLRAHQTWYAEATGSWLRQRRGWR